MPAAMKVGNVTKFETEVYGLLFAFLCEEHAVFNAYTKTKKKLGPTKHAYHMS